MQHHPHTHQSQTIVSPFLISVPPTTQIVNISRTDRWFVYHRLQELMIPCWCLEDGSLWVEVKNSINAILVRSVVQHCISPRRELVNWLERCWQMKD